MSDYAAEYYIGILLGFPTLQYVPWSVVAGDTVTFNVCFESFASTTDGTTCVFYVNGPTVGQVSGVPNSSSGGWTFTISSALSQNWPAGIYAYAYKVTCADGTVHTAQSGRLNVKANIATAAANSLRTQAEKELELIGEAILKKLRNPLDEGSFYGKSLKTIDLAVLQKYYAVAEYRVWCEQNPGIRFKPILTTRIYI